MTTPSVPIIREASQGEKINLSETWYQVWKGTGETTHGIVDSWLEVVPPRIGPPEHKHARYDESFYVVKGTFQVKVDGRLVEASAGAWVFVPGGVAHTFTNVGSEDGHLIIEAFPGGGMSEYFKEVSAVVAARPTTSGPPDQQALQQVDAKYGVEPVGPPLSGK